MSLSFFERVFLLAFVVIETDSITITINASLFFVSIETPYRIIGFLLNTPARPRYCENACPQEFHKFE